MARIFLSLCVMLLCTLIVHAVDDPIGALVKQVVDNPNDATYASICQLAESDDPRVEDALIAVLGSKEISIRSMAISSLGWWRNERSVAALAPLNKDIVACRALATMGPLAVPALLEALESNDPDIVALAAGTLSKQHELLAVDPMLTILTKTDKNRQIRGSLIYALGKIGDPRVVEPIKAAIDTKLQDINICMTALVNIGSKEALDVVIKMANGNRYSGIVQVAQGALANFPTLESQDEFYARATDADINVRRAVFGAMTIRCDMRYEDILVAALNDADADIVRYAVISLGHLVSTKAVPKLLDMLTTADDKGLLRQPLVESLGYIGDSRAVPTLIKGLKPIKYNNIFTINALGRIGDSAAVPALIDLLDVSNPDGILNYLVGINDPRTIEPLAAMLVKPNLPDSTRLSIAIALAHFKDSRALDVLLANIPATDSWNASRIIDAIGELGDARAVPQIIAKMGGEKTYTGEYPSVKALAKIGTPAVEQLIAAMKNENEKTVQRAALALGKIGDPRAINSLTVALTSTQRGVGDAAATALGNISDPRAVDALAGALDMPGSVSNAAAIALGYSKDPRAIDLLKGALLKKTPNAPSVIKSLGDLGARDAAPLILPYLNDGNFFSIIAAITALGQLKSTEAVEPLITIMDNSPVINNYGAIISYWDGAATTLAKIGDPRPVDRLLAALEARHSHAPAAARALGIMKEPRAWDMLLEDISDLNPTLRAAAVKALGDFGDKRATDKLIPLLNDGDMGVRITTFNALGALNDPHAIPAIIAYTTRYSEFKDALALCAIDAPASTDALMRGLITEKQGYNNKTVFATLKQRSGKDYGTSIPAWRKWWRGEAQ